MDRQTLSIMKACEAVGVSRRTIYNWISAGKVEYVRTAGGSSGSSPTRCGATRGAQPGWSGAVRRRRRARVRTERCERVDVGVETARPRPHVPSDALRALFHRLNNQLGIILAHAELLEAKAADDAAHVRVRHRS